MKNYYYLCNLLTDNKNKQNNYTNKMKVNKLFLLIITMTVGVAVTSCVDIPQMKQTSFETLTVKKGLTQVEQTHSATIIGKTNVKITPMVSGILTAIKVQPGQIVKKGQLLFVIDQRQAQIEISNAKANLQAAEAQMNTAKLEMESNANLFQKGIVSDYMYKTAQDAYNRSVAAVAQAKAAVSAAKLSLDYCNVTSPVSGIVGAVPVELGQMVSAGVELTTISENSDVRARYSVSENDLLAIADSTSATSLKEYIATSPQVKLRLKDGSEYPYPGRLSSITGVMDARTGTLTIEAVFPNPQGSLTSGLQGTVVVPQQLNDVIVVPNTAVVRIQDKTLVYRVGADSCAVGTVVTAREINGKEFVVTDGLKPGDIIVAKGASNVQDKQRVLF